MRNYEFIQWGGAMTGLLFFFAFGAVCGSFINVLAYRIPKGLNIVTPPSACPACGTRLSWRDNLPIIGWMFLRGRCRYCRSPISAQYPAVELVVASLFGLVFALWFMDPSIFTPLGVDVRFWRPEWAHEAGAWRAWPMLLVVLAVVGSLVTATIIDAKTFLIPLSIPWFMAAVGMIVHPLHALWFTLTPARRGLATFEWTIPVPHAGWLGVAFGGAAGLLASVGLLRLGVLPQSFADYDQWERDHAANPPTSAPVDASESPALSSRDLVVRSLLFTGPAVALLFLGFGIGSALGFPAQGAAIGLGVGLLLGLFLRQLAPGADDPDDQPVWAGYPHVRREMGKEILFCLPILLGAVLGWWLTRAGGPLAGAAAVPALPVAALGGSLLGLLVGGAAVWATRILGSLAFGKEAMGLGDVHLMAGVGAALGWVDPLLAFLIAPFLGLGWAALSVVSSGLFKREGTALPYGPHLAAATLLVVVFKPVFEAVLSGILNQRVNLP